MIDWHSHILPGMDDGSEDVPESLAMLECQAQQGVKTVIATPHFYANDESVADFVSRRQKAYDTLKAQLPEDAPDLVLGAEVRYYRGISRMENIEALQIQGTKLLLLEMPIRDWAESMLKDLTELAGSGRVQLVLAHIDRYWGIQKGETWSRLHESGILMQANASFFTGFATKRKAVSLLNEGLVQLIGSDGHNMTTRPPHLEKACRVIGKKLGNEFLEQMTHYGYSLFTEDLEKLFEGSL